jgi:hypothetical protein
VLAITRAGMPEWLKRVWFERIMRGITLLIRRVGREVVEG